MPQVFDDLMVRNNTNDVLVKIESKQNELSFTANEINEGDRNSIKYFEQSQPAVNDFFAISENPFTQNMQQMTNSEDLATKHE